MQPDAHELAIQEAVARGDAVPDSVLEGYKDRPWAKAEIEARQGYIEEAKTLQFRDADEFTSFHDAMSGPDDPTRSYTYWQMIWEKAGGDINVSGEEGFKAVPPAEANKRFIKSVDDPDKMMYFLLELDRLTKEDPTRKAGLQYGASGLPKAVWLAYLEAKKLSISVSTWAAAFKSMKTEPERYRELAAASGDEEEQRQLQAEANMEPAEQTRLRAENARLRRELKMFREVEKEGLSKGSFGKELWQITQAEWIARWPKDERKPVGFLESHKARVREAILSGKPVPDDVLADYPDLRRISSELAAAPVEAVAPAAAPIAKGKKPKKALKAQWDFANTFPMPEQDAIQSGAWSGSVGIEAVQDVHETLGKEMIADLEAIIVTEEAQRLGVDPRSG